MMSVIQVQCPHCHAKGRMTIPSMASIILAGCPRCEEPVIIFLGRAHPLSKEVLLEGTVEERREHILSVLTEVLGKGVDELLAQDAFVTGMSAEQEYEELAQEPGPGVMLQDQQSQNRRGPIAQSEFDRFVLNDLGRLDDGDYFKSVFGQN